MDTGLMFFHYCFKASKGFKAAPGDCTPSNLPVGTASRTAVQNRDPGPRAAGTAAQTRNISGPAATPSAQHVEAQDTCFSVQEMSCHVPL